MPCDDKRLRAVLDGYGKFLRQRKLAPANQMPCVVRWVQDFLLFARAHGGYTLGQTLDMFLASRGRQGYILRPDGLRGVG